MGMSSPLPGTERNEGNKKKERPAMTGKLSYYLSEVIGTFFMILIGISAIAFNFGTTFMSEAIPSANWGLLITGIGVGALVATLVFFTVNISGTSLNPARSLGPAFAVADNIR